jgi:hypothetical protein
MLENILDKKIANLIFKIQSNEVKQFNDRNYLKGRTYLVTKFIPVFFN